MILPSLVVVSIYNDGKEVTSERRLIIMGSSERLPALKKGIHDGEE